MKVYVCYTAYEYEGCSEPITAFYKREDAEAWVKAKEANQWPRESAHWEELEVE